MDISVKDFCVYFNKEKICNFALRYKRIIEVFKHYIFIDGEKNKYLNNRVDVGFFNCFCLDNKKKRREFCLLFPASFFVNKSFKFVDENIKLEIYNLEKFNLYLQALLDDNIVYENIHFMELLEEKEENNKFYVSIINELKLNYEKNNIYVKMNEIIKKIGKLLNRNIRNQDLKEIYNYLSRVGVIILHDNKAVFVKNINNKSCRVSELNVDFFNEMRCKSIMDTANVREDCMGFFWEIYNNSVNTYMNFSDNRVRNIDNSLRFGNVKNVNFGLQNSFMGFDEAQHNIMSRNIENNKISQIQK